MTQYKINRIYKLLSSIYQNKMSSNDAYAIYAVKKHLEPIYQFELEREQKLMDEYSVSIDGNGSLTGGDKETIQAFVSSINELNTMDVCLEYIPRMKVSLCALNGCDLSPCDLEYIGELIDIV